MAAVGTQFPLTSSDRAHSHQVASGLRLSSRTHAMTGNETLTLDSYVALANYCRCADNYWRLRCADNWNATRGLLTCLRGSHFRALFAPSRPLPNLFIGPMQLLFRHAANRHHKAPMLFWDAALEPRVDRLFSHKLSLV